MTICRLERYIYIYIYILKTFIHMGDWANWATREKKQMETNEDEIDKKMMTKKKKKSTRNNRLMRNIMRTRNNRMRNIIRSRCCAD